MKSYLTFAIVTLTLTLIASSLMAVDADGTYVIATKESPPFITVDSQGTPQGFSVDLWNSLLNDSMFTLDRPKFRWALADSQEIIDGVENGTYDAGIAAITVSADRSRHVDFTHPFLSSGIGIAVAPEKRNTISALLYGFLSPAFIGAVTVLLVLLVVPGTLMWLVERHKNPDHFGGKTTQGIGNGLWWSAVTMSTVGYGDKVPITLAGRFIALVWIFVSLIMVSTITASLTSAATTNALTENSVSMKNFRNHSVGVIAHSTTEYVLNDSVKDLNVFTTLNEALDALNDNIVQAVAHDIPLLKHAQVDHENIEILPDIYRRQDYAICLPFNSRLRQPLNQAIMHHIDNGKIAPLLDQYFDRP